jgi:hypothetical protein
MSVITVANGTATARLDARRGGELVPVRLVGTARVAARARWVAVAALFCAAALAAAGLISRGGVSWSCPDGCALA